MSEVAQSYPERKNPFRVLEGEKHLHYVECTFPGLEGTVLPTFEYLQSTIAPLLDPETREKLMEYFEAVLLVLPGKKHLSLPDFREAKWRKNQSLQEKCRQWGIVLSRSIQEINSAWYVKEKTVKADSHKEGKFILRTRKRSLSEEEKIWLKETKAIIRRYLSILNDAERQKERLFQQRRKEVLSRIQALQLGVQRAQEKHATEQRALYVRIEELKVEIVMNRRRVHELVEGLQERLFQEQEELEAIERRKGLDEKLKSIWDVMRFNGELPDESSASE